jgi:predicted HTH domain antitoxin
MGMSLGRGRPEKRGALMVSSLASPLPYTDTVRISLDIPDDLVRQLAEGGKDLSRAALEALAIDAYRMNRITGFQLRTLLDIPSRHELDELLKHHGVPLEYTMDDFDREGQTSARLWRKRRDEDETSTGF